MQTSSPSIDALSDKLNPIVVRELRQMVRSKLVLGALMLLLILLVVSTLFYVLASLGDDPYSRHSMFGGRDLFNWFNGFLTFCGMFFVPLYVGSRLAKERSSGNDLLYITTLSPNKIITGKVLAGVMITVLLFSICLPFLSFSYLLRGIDLPTIFSSLVLSFIQIVALIYIAIVAALFPVSHVLRILGSLALVFNLFYAVGLSIAGAFGLQRAGITSQFNEPGFWLGVAYFGLCIAQGLALCHCAAVAWLSPEASNRMRPIRLLIWFSWLFHTAVLLVYAEVKADFLLEIWGILSVLAAAALWMIAISEREAPGHVVASLIPANSFLRFRSWLTFSGSGGGLMSGSLLFALTMGLLSARTHFGFLGSVHTGFSNDDWLRYLSFGLYLLGFCLLALWIRRVLLTRRVVPNITWALALIVLGLTPLLHLIFMLFMGEDMDNYSDFFQPGNVFNLMEEDLLPYHATAAIIFCLVLLLAHARWLTGQWKGFRRPEPERQDDHA